MIAGAKRHLLLWVGNCEDDRAELHCGGSHWRTDRVVENALPRAAGSPCGDVEKKLLELENLVQKELITREEYEATRRQLIDCL